MILFAMLLLDNRVHIYHAIKAVVIGTDYNNRYIIVIPLVNTKKNLYFYIAIIVAIHQIL